MSWPVRTGFRILLWIVSVLTYRALTEGQRADLQAIITSFNNESAVDRTKGDISS